MNTPTTKRGRPVRRPLLYLALLVLTGLATTACWPFPGLSPAPTPLPASATPAPGASTPTPGAPATAGGAGPTATGAEASVQLPPMPTWPPAPAWTPNPAPTPPTLATPGPGAALALPPEPLPDAIAPALRPEKVGDLQGKATWPRYQMALRLDTDAGQLWGHERLQMTNTEDGPLTELVLRLVPDFPPSMMDDQALAGAARLRVGAVLLDDQPVRATYRDANTSLVVPLATPLAPGAAATVTFDFAVSLVKLGDPGAWHFQSFYPILAVYDHGAWHEEVTEFPDRVYAESSFYAVDMTVPTGTLLASSGSEVSAQDNGDGTTTHALRAGPVREFSVTACRTCGVAEGQADGVLVRATYPQANAQEGHQDLATAIGALSVYSATFGAYPYREFDVVLWPPVPGGIEYPGLIYVGSTSSNTTRPFLVAHETGHQWWYGMVGDDIFREAWLDEAFANYSAVIYAEKALGPGAGTAMFDGAAGAWKPYQRLKLQADPHVDQPVGSALWQFPDFWTYDAVIYGKGAVFLQKLRTVMGDDAFFAGLRDHFAKNQYGVTTGRGFLATMLAHAGAQAPAAAQLYEAWIEGR